ncbi:hypothetical protein AAFF_G00440740 [Aldrovandia affinis]|uniref:TFIIS N-terminal domain-containing protein n=1 Tax=Aldrovandia affinis TaxID=143900 RepID=A0AAD7S769_9TELE|nr:hypothetical protein AAFF_G00440740 [Aldrovandia affinis]
MDGEEDEFFSGNHSDDDDGGGTPVQDEHAPVSDVEEDAKSDAQQSEEGLSEGEGEGEAEAGQANGIGSASENEDARGPGDSDSEKDGAHDSDSEQEAPKPADSDVEEEEEEEEEEAAGPGPKERGSGSENEERTRPQGGHSDAGSDSESETPKHRRRVESDMEEEEGEQQEKEQGTWKGVMHSDSEEEEEKQQEGGQARPAGSDHEQDDGNQQHQQQQQQQLHDSDDDEEEDKPVKRKKAILSDSEDEDEKDVVPVAKKSRALMDAENSDSDAASDSPDKSMAAKLRELGSDSEEEEDRSKDNGGKKDEKVLFGSDSDSGDEEEKMIADIFGESGDEEEEEFTGFNQEDLEGDKSQSEASAKNQVAEESDSDDDDVDRSGKDLSFMSDFDVMLARKKAQSGRRRRNRDGGTFISDADDVVSAMITKMTEAAEEDRTLNSQKKPALKKLTLLPTVVMHLKKQDLKETFIDSGVMSAIKEWISPLPDKSLPALKIREELLKILQELPSVSQETLKHSGIGRAVMFLYKHPKESRPNKDLALKLINEWSRPIFGLTSNYKGMTREERQQRDLDQQMPTRRRLSSGGQTPRRDLEKVLTGEEKALRPGDPGFCARARVPMPSNKDYVVRPKWNVDVETNRGPMKKGMSRVDKQMRRFADIRRLTKTGHAVKISVEGNRMPL